MQGRMPVAVECPVPSSVAEGTHTRVRSAYAKILVDTQGRVLTFPFGGRLELRLVAWLKDLVEKLRVLVLEADRLLVLGLLVISSLLTAEIFDPLLVLAGDCGALFEPELLLKELVLAPGEDTDPARVRLRPVRGMVSPLAPPPRRLSPLSREKQS